MCSSDLFRCVCVSRVYVCVRGMVCVVLCVCMHPCEDETVSRLVLFSTAKWSSIVSCDVYSLMLSVNLSCMVSDLYLASNPNTGCNPGLPLLLSRGSQILQSSLKHTDTHTQTYRHTHTQKNTKQRLSGSPSVFWVLLNTPSLVFLILSSSSSE